LAFGTASLIGTRDLTNSAQSLSWHTSRQSSGGVLDGSFGVNHEILLTGLIIGPSRFTSRISCGTLESLLTAIPIHGSTASPLSTLETGKVRFEISSRSFVHSTWLKNGIN